MRLSKGPIKLINLLPLREAEKAEKAADAEEEDPFAGGEEGASEEEGDKEDKPAEAESPKPKVRFDVSAVKKYNKAQFLGDEGEILSADKTGMKVHVVPDDVLIHVNFQDIL